MSNQRTGLLIIRAWVEAESSEPLRAHVKITSDISAGIEQSLTLARPDEVREVVSVWLDGLLGSLLAPPAG